MAVALVTGASRGIGKGVALELGKAGFTVYLTGRPKAQREAGLLGDLHQAAEEVTALGGKGIAVECDHHDDQSVATAFDVVRAAGEGLDVLVNNVFSVPELGKAGRKPFWEQPISAYDEPMIVGARSHYVASYFAAPMMIEAGHGLIVNISSTGAVTYANSVGYGVGKAAVDKITTDIGYELAKRNVAVVSLWPGTFVYTELNTSRGLAELPPGETPRFTGKAVVALANDPNVMDKAARVFTCVQIAHAYGFTEDDGSMPGDLDPAWVAKRHDRRNPFA
ncbi:MAG: SDR family NAD(P)-dependent oxidoreductase [Acidimicrobiia bacterium]